MTKLSVQLPFAGFYDTSHSQLFDDYIENEIEYLRDEHGLTNAQADALQSAFYDSDFKAMHRQYAKDYAAAFFDLLHTAGTYINERSPKTFLPELCTIKYDFESLESPKYYNYNTDRIYVKIDQTILQAMLSLVLTHYKEGFFSLIADQYTSYDGFHSFHPNTFEEWPSNIAEWGEARLGTVLQAFTIYTLETYEVKDIDLNDVLSGYSLMEDYRCNGNFDNLVWEFASAEYKQLSEAARAQLQLAL
jgi:hypothetical protein